MWPVDEEMKTFNALPYGDKLRVGRYLTRGEAPDDPRMASAAVELAECYQRQSRAYMRLMRWFPTFMIVCYGYLTISRAEEGDHLMLFIYPLIIGLSALHFLLTPQFDRRRCTGLSRH